jgi:hypothetical protein
VACGPAEEAFDVLLSVACRAEITLFDDAIDNRKHVAFGYRLHGPRFPPREEMGIQRPSILASCGRAHVGRAVNVEIVIKCLREQDLAFQRCD